MIPTDLFASIPLVDDEVTLLLGDTTPPAPLVPLPTDKRAAPPRPPVDAPEPRAMQPPFPVFDDPELNASRPPDPLVPPFDDRSATCPLLDEAKRLREEVALRRMQRVGLAGGRTDTPDGLALHAKH